MDAQQDGELTLRPQREGIQCTVYTVVLQNKHSVEFYLLIHSFCVYMFGCDVMMYSFSKLVSPSAQQEDVDGYETMVVKEDDDDSVVS